MKRHRHDAIGFGEERPARRAHHTRHRRGKVVPVLIFQAVDEAPCDIVVQRDGPGPRESGRSRESFRGDEPPHAEVDGKGNAEPVAERLVDEAKPRPAGGAERAGIRCRQPATGTGRRIDESERCAFQPAPEGDDAAYGAASGVGEGAQRAAAGCIACWSASRALALARWRPMAQPAAAPTRP